MSYQLLRKTTLSPLNDNDNDNGWVCFVKTKTLADALIVKRQCNFLVKIKFVED